MALIVIFEGKMELTLHNIAKTTSLNEHEVFYALAVLSNVKDISYKYNHKRKDFEWIRLNENNA